MYVVALLSLAVELLVARAEHAYIHVEVEYVGLGEHLLQFDGLLDARYAAHLRAVALAYLLVARAYAVQQRYAPRRRAVGETHRTLVHHAFQIGRRYDVVVYAVAVLLLAASVE